MSIQSNLELPVSPPFHAELITAENESPCWWLNLILLTVERLIPAYSDRVSKPLGWVRYEWRWMRCPPRWIYARAWRIGVARTQLKQISIILASQGTENHQWQVSCRNSWSNLWTTTPLIFFRGYKRLYGLQLKKDSSTSWLKSTISSLSLVILIGGL